MPTRARKSKKTNSSNTNDPSSSETTPKKSSVAKHNLDHNATRTLHSFFNAATQRMQQHSRAEGNSSVNDTDTNGDTIEDDQLDDVRPRKRSFKHVSNENGLSRIGSESASLAKKFLKTSHTPTTTAAAAQNAFRNVDKRPCEIDARPWTEKYCPQSLEELAVHKRKVADVREWLETVFAQNTTQRLLILKGPTGSGKTITVSLLVRIMGLEIVDWTNPTSTKAGSGDYTSISSQFNDFINRGGAFNALEFEDQTNTSDVIDTESLNQETQKQLLLVEEFPSLGSQALSSLELFRSSLLRYVASDSTDRARSSRKKPLVMIISESFNSSGQNNSDIFTAHRLFGPSLLNHSNVRLIEFNPVAPTFITKALKTTLLKHSKSSGHNLMPDMEIIHRLSELGDIRNATSALEFVCLESEASDMRKGQIASKVKLNRSTKSVASSRGNEVAHSLISLRESTLGLFHAVGKVVHNKRLPSNEECKVNESTLSKHHSLKIRPQPSEIDVDDLASSTGTDTSTFISALHENYLMSCASVEFDDEAALDVVNGVLDSLSDSDVLLNHQHASDYHNSAHERRTEEDLAFNTSVRGTLFYLPYPVKRISLTSVPGRGGKADAHRMFYPVSQRLWRIQEEKLGTVEWLTKKAMDGALLPAHTQSLQGSTLKPWVSGISQPGRMPFRPANSGVVPNEKTSRMKHDQSQPAQSFGPMSIGSGNSARLEMLLERLPYLALIYQKTALPDIAVQAQLRSVTKFTGVDNLFGGNDDDDRLEIDSNISKAKLPFGTSSKSMIFTSKSSTAASSHLASPISPDVGKLILSDDDIEDE